MTNSLVDEAKKLLKLEAEKLLNSQATAEDISQKETHNILFRLFTFLYKKSVLQEVLVYWHKENLEYISSPETMHSNLAGQVDIFNDIGEPNHKHLLMQEDVWDDHGGEPYTNYKAKAVKYDDVFGRDLYIIPYQNAKNGFACRVVNEKFGINKFFPHDIDRQYAIEWIADYLRTHR